MGDRHPLPDMFSVDMDAARRQAELPSAQRDFVPTPGGWAGILIVAAILGWAIWELRGDDAGLGWLVTSGVIGYSIAAVGWSVIRQALDDREDRNQAR